MPTVVTINRPDIVALIETAADKLTGGKKTAAVALAMRRLLDQEARAGSLFGAHPGSVQVREGVDLTAPALDDVPDAESGQEIGRRAAPFCWTPISRYGWTAVARGCVNPPWR